MVTPLHPKTGLILQKCATYFAAEKLASDGTRQNIRSAVYALVSNDGTDRSMADKLASVAISALGCSRMCDEKPAMIEEAVRKLATVGQIDEVLRGVELEDSGSQKMAVDMRHLNWEYGMRVLSELTNV